MNEVATDMSMAEKVVKICYEAREASRKRSNEEAEDTEDAVNFAKRQKRKLPRKECVTCCNDVAINRFPKLPHKSAENHERNVCFECWEQHLVSQVEGNGWEAICCPQCEEKLEGTEIKKLASIKTYQV